MKIIRKYKGEDIVFIIDEEDAVYLERHKFSAAKRASGFYLYCGTTNRYFHRIVMGEPKGVFIDHINRDTTDNRKENLRLVTHKQNLANSRKTKKACTSKYKGVSWCAFSSKYRATINVNEKQKTLGRYATEAQAAEAYNQAALKLRGKFANINKV